MVLLPTDHEIKNRVWAIEHETKIARILEVVMWSDIDPYKWSLKNWAIFLFRVLVPTAIVVAWIVYLVLRG